MARYRHDPLRVPDNAKRVATYDQDGALLDPDGNIIPSVGELANDLEAGDLLYFDGDALSRIPVGTNGQVLTVVEGKPAWATP